VDLEGDLRGGVCIEQHAPSLRADKTGLWPTLVTIWYRAF